MEEFDALGISYAECPVNFDRDRNKIIEPTSEDFHRAAESVRNGKNYKLIWNDAMATGMGFVAIYDWLIKEGVKDEEIKTASILDNIGLTEELCIIKGPNYRKKPRDKLINDIREYLEMISPREKENYLRWLRDVFGYLFSWR